MLSTIRFFEGWIICIRSCMSNFAVIFIFLFFSRIQENIHLAFIKFAEEICHLETLKTKRMKIILQFFTWVNTDSTVISIYYFTII